MPETTVHLKSMLPLVLPYVPGCSDVVATENLRLAATEYCERTRCWRYRITQTIAQAEEPITVPVYAAVHEIDKAEFNGQPLDPVPFADITMNELEADGAPRYITQATESSLIVFPFQPGDVELALFLKPRQGQLFGQGADGPLDNQFARVPDFVFQNHAESISFGAIARLKRQLNVEYSDPAGALFFDGQFQGRIDRASSGFLRGQQRARVRTQILDY